MRLVVDASVALKWFLKGRPEELNVAEAEAVAAAIGLGDTGLFAPAHWTTEVIAVLARAEPDLVDDALIILDDMRPAVIGGVQILKRAALGDGPQPPPLRYALSCRCTGGAGHAGHGGRGVFQ